MGDLEYRGVGWEQRLTSVPVKYLHVYHITNGLGIYLCKCGLVILVHTKELTNPPIVNPVS